MRSFPWYWYVPALLWSLTVGTTIAAPPPAPPQPVAEKPVREIFVPFEDLNVILAGKTERVFLSRKEFAQLVARAEITPAEKAPVGATVLSADYVGQFEDGRVQVRGTLDVEVLEDGLHRVPLTLSGVGLHRATLDDKPAPLGRRAGGAVSLLVDGRGSHRLELELVIPLVMTAAQQSLTFQIPTPPSTRLRLTVPGNIEVKSGATVVSRKLSDDGGSTQFELVPGRGPTSIVMSVNNRLLREQSVVVAQSVIVNEITQAYDRVHARVSMDVLHGAVDQFRFTLPDDFEVTTVEAAELSHWEVDDGGDHAVLVTHLREPASGSVALNISAEKTPASLAAWTAARLEPMNVAGHTSVIGVVLDDRLNTQGMTASGLIAIDNEVLTDNVPESVFQAEPGAPQIRPVATFYAAEPDYQLSGRFDVPSGQVRATTNLLLAIGAGRHKVFGGFALQPEGDDLFDVKFTAPPDWHVTKVTSPKGNPLAVERYKDEQYGDVVHVRLPAGIKAGHFTTIRFQAETTPTGWLSEWQQNAVAFPVFAVVDAASDAGAIGVLARDDLNVRATDTSGLIPLDSNDKNRGQFAGVPATLTFSYDAQPYELGIAVERTAPWIMAQTYSFFTVTSNRLKAHYEIDYFVQQAATRQLTLELPVDTPEALSIVGLDGVGLKEFSSAVENDVRRWTILLAERRRGRIRLAVEFQQPMDTDEPKDFAMPLIRAVDVAFQSGHIAVEGSAELDVQIETSAREVDAGEMADAEYLPGRRLLGAYAYGGGEADVKINVTRHPGYALPQAIVQQAEMVTALSASGVAQTVARYDLRTKAAFLEIELPAKSTLWTALLDHQPTKPLGNGDPFLLSLPSQKKNALRTLQIVYETPADAVTIAGSVDIKAPRLFLRASQTSPRAAVPIADVNWHLNLPPGYRVTSSDGTVFTKQIDKRPSPLAFLTHEMYQLAGGANPWYMYPASTNARDEVSRAVVKSAETRGHATEDNERGPAEDGFQGGEFDEAEEGDDSMDRAGAGALSLNDGHRRKEGYDQPLEPPVPPVDLPATESEPEGGKSGEKPDEPEATDDPFAKEGFDEEKIDEQRDGGMDDFIKKQPPKSTRSRSGQWALEGIGSLDIDIAKADNVVVFQGFGAEPQLKATLVNDQRVQSLALAIALLILLIGVVLTRRPARTKAKYVIAVALISTLAPLITGWVNELGATFDLAFYAACLLVIYYPVVALMGWLVGQVRSRLQSRKGSDVLELRKSRNVATASTLLIAIFIACQSAMVAQGEAPKQPLVIQVAPPPTPVTVPDDAIIVPYDASKPDLQASIAAADKLLIPYAKYVELWNRAYPDKKIQAAPLAADFALAGAAFQSELNGDEFLLVSGQIEIDVFRDGAVVIPLPLQGGVLSQAVLDGRPAKMQIVAPSATPAQGDKVQKQVAERKLAAGGLVLLHVSGKGRHRLQLAAQMRLRRQGGWRVVSGHIPAAPATTLSLVVPQPKTEVRLAGVFDRREYETDEPGQTIKTALSADGQINLQWRPQVAEGQLDRRLTANSSAVLDVREDSLQLHWTLKVDFGRSERPSVAVTVPKDYLIEKVQGDNVRGWSVKEAGERQQLEITLLQAARGVQTINLKLATYAAVGGEALADFDAPQITVIGAMLHRGQFTIRRSPILNLKTIASAGVSRVDVGSANELDEVEDSPLGVRPYEAYRFSTTPFTLQLAAEEITAATSATVQTLLKVAERETTVESLVRFSVQARRVHRVRLAIPDSLKLKGDVEAPEPFQWSKTMDDGRQIVTIYLAQGQLGEFPVVFRGTIDGGAAGKSLAVPQIEVLDVARQQGDFVVQLDPAFNANASDLAGSETILLEQVHGWLTDKHQRATAQLALRYRAPGYAAKLNFSPRQPRVDCRTITNVRVSERAVEETILLNFTIREAGIRQVAFQLPQSMQSARISAPLLRQKTVTPIEGQPAVRVQLDLQDDVIGQFGVKIVHDRLLTSAEQSAPIPLVETGDTERRYVVLENAGRDEVVVNDHGGLDRLGRQQQQWRELAELFGTNLTQAYLVRRGAAQPQLTFQTKQRQAVKTAGATIGLAMTTLLIDGVGAYRGVQEYRVDNQTEQFLEIQLPEGAQLWTARVAGAPVKPVEVAGSTTQGSVQIPLIKTAQGDRDYAVQLSYGGRLEAFSSFSSVSFPLIRTVNIQPEQSQVRLFLPETHHWYGFDGTMKPAEEEELLFGQMDYNTKSFQKFSRVYRGEDEYAKARANANLGSLQIEQRELQEKARALAQTESLQSNYYRNSGAAEKAIRQSQDSQQRDFGQVGLGNRGRIDDYWKQQETGRAKNIVNQAGDNFDLRAEIQKGFRSANVDKNSTTSVFNKKWFDANDLRNPTDIEGRKMNRYYFEKFDGKGKTATIAEPGEPPIVYPSAEVWKELEPRRKKYASVDQKLGRPPVPNFGPGQGQGEGQGQGQGSPFGVPGGTLGNDTTKKRASRYQSKLQRQGRAGNESMNNRAKDGDADKTREGTADFETLNTKSGKTDEGIITADSDISSSHAYAEITGGSPRADFSSAQPPSGLASLDIKLPQRGRKYCFTTPRGEVEITARSIAAPTLQRSQSLGWVLGAAILIALIARWVRRGGLLIFSGRGGAITLTVVGIASLLTYVLPVVGMLAVIVGVLLYVRSRTLPTAI